MKPTHIIAACIALCAGAASAYPYESEFKARGAYAHDDYRDHGSYGYGRDYGYGRGYGDHRGGWRGDGYGYGHRGRHCWTEHRHHRDYRVCR